MVNPTWDWNVVLIFTLIALIGGALGYTARTVGDGKEFRLGIFFVEGFSSAFFGFLIGVIDMEQGVSLGFGGAIIGVLSWGGSRAMLKFVKEKISGGANKVNGVNHETSD